MTWRPILFTLALLGVLITGAPARAGDAEDIRAVISAQINAFRTDDAAAAFSYAAPGIRSMFGTEDRFMKMVRSGYPSVYRASNVVFGKLEPYRGGFRQDVHLTGPKGRSWVASYTLERQPDGTMKITGCVLSQSEETSV